MLKRFFSLVMVLTITGSFLFSAVPSASALASDDYTQWKQTDSAWNQQEAWPKSEYPNATMYTMEDCGCVVTAIAILLRHYNIVTDSNVNNFNPWICNEHLKSVGAFDSAANIRFDKIQDAYPGLKFIGDFPYSAANLNTLFSQGYACIVKVQNGRYNHFVAVKSATSTSAEIMDPGYSRRNSLSDYSTKLGIYCFQTSTGAVSSGSNPTLPTISGSNAPTALKEGQAFSIKGTVSSTTKITSVTAGIYSVNGSYVTGAPTVNPNSTSYSLTKIDPYIYFNKLSAGTYYYRVTATNSAGTATLINQQFTVNPKATYATISGYNTPPSTLTVGKAFSIKGTISSTTKITSVTVGIYDKSGSYVTGAPTVNPGTTSYSLSKLDPYVYFNRLSAGNYIYKVSATNSAGTKILVESEFAVGNPTQYYAIAPACAPSTRLDVQGGSTENQGNVQIYTDNGTDAQRWELRSLGGGYFAIISRVSGKALDVQWGTAESGTNVWQYEYNGSAAQQWGFIDAGNGYYYIVSRLNHNLCLDVSGGGSSSGLNVQIWSRNNTDAQKWKLYT